MIVRCPDCGHIEELVVGGRGHNCPGPPPKKVTEAQFRALMDRLGIRPGEQEAIMSAKLAEGRDAG